MFLEDNENLENNNEIKNDNLTNNELNSDHLETNSEINNSNLNNNTQTPNDDLENQKDIEVVIGDNSNLIISGVGDLMNDLKPKVQKRGNVIIPIPKINNTPKPETNNEPFLEDNNNEPMSVENNNEPTPEENNDSENN